MPPSRASVPPSRASVPPPAAFALAAATLVPACAAPTRSEAPPPAEGRAVTLAQLDVTSGVVVEKEPTVLATQSGAMRAVAPHTAGDGAELRFTYLGPTAETTRLANGEVRSQVGLKLRAEDTCNVLYVMWRLDDAQRLTVGIKQNPGQHTHEECGAGGYVNVTPEYTAPLPALGLGERHVLRAAVEDGRLVVLADDRVVWEGPLPDSALSLEGPIGLRADNARLDMELVPVRRGAEWPTRGPPPKRPSFGIEEYPSGIPPPRGDR